MANLMDYLDWRGDLTLDQSPFNEVDNLILAELSFVDFQGTVPGPGEGEGVVLREAAEAFFARFPEGEKIDMGVLVPGAIPEMLGKMASSRRFGAMKLNCFTDHLDVGKGEQFAALTIETGDGLLYLSFRGTDDTLAGWKEDFELACMPEVPAQKKAVRYVRDVAKQYPRRRLRLGGHSKGGNLAVYAAVFCPAAVQRRIEDVWSNDGPGFHEDLLDLPEHRRVADRIRSIVPKSSVVGMLLEHEEDYAVVDSDQQGLFQHDLYSWQIQGPDFVRLEEVDAGSRMIDRALKDWLAGLTNQQRETVADTLYELLSSGDAKLVSEALEPQNLADALRAVKDVAPKDLLILAGSMARLAGAALRAL